tara:strand:- start:177 stop:608 length:432 start_codon:yes stop_codon:yes gene_type:complete
MVKNRHPRKSCGVVVVRNSYLAVFGVIAHLSIRNAPVAQRIESRSPKAVVQVRVLPGAPTIFGGVNVHCLGYNTFMVNINENPSCTKCLDNGYWLQFYERPGGRPGNSMIPCDQCEKGRELKAKYDSIKFTITTTGDDDVNVY